MANFCTRCGRPLAEGEVCNCGGAAPTPTPTPTPAPNPIPSNFNAETAKGFFETVKNHMGIGDPDLNKGDAFEEGKLIVPECIEVNEGEIPIKQYKVATLRSRILCFPYTKAIGRIQVTNKRVIFRAPGRCLAGRTTLQHEFAIDEIAGLEARREYVFNFWDLLVGIIVSAFGGAVMTALVTAIAASIDSYKAEMVVAGILAFIVGVAGCLPFVMLKKKWLLKLLCLGGSYMPLLSIGVTLHEYGSYSRSGGGAATFFGGVLIFLGVIVALAALFTLIVYSIRPNLVLIVKTKAANEAIDIRRKKIRDSSEHTGYSEVLPAEDAERCIREIDAMINDIQKLGDFGIEKWKA